MTSPPVPPSDARSKRLRFRTRLTILLVSAVSGVVALISAYFVVKHGADLREATNAKSRLLRDELTKRGLGMARSVSLASERAVVVRDFLFLTEIVNSTVSNDSDIVYGIIMDGEQRALVHSDTKLQGEVLSDDASTRAAETKKPDVQDRLVDGQRVLEVMSPIVVEDKRWGTIRIGLSLKSLEREIAATEEASARQTAESIITMVVVALVLMVLVSMGGVAYAGRLLAPLNQLMGGVMRIREGQLDQTLTVQGSLEFEELAHAFNGMAAAIRERDQTLRQNLSDLERALSKAEEANRLKSEFLASISHELRTPLNAIVNVPVTLLQDYKTHLLWSCESCGGSFEGPPPADPKNPRSTEPCLDCKKPTLVWGERVFMQGDPKDHRHFLSRLKQQSQHLLSVVNDLLDFSKLEARKMKLALSQVEIPKLTVDLVETIGGLAREKNITLTTGAGEGQLVGDQVKLMQILINLVGNAIKFTPNGGSVEVRAGLDPASSPDLVRFSVRDTGIGIPKDKLEVVFESFRQVDGTHTKAHGGTGLGLAIARQLVEMHGGRIWCESDRGKGSTFTFEVMKVAPTQPEDTGPHPVPAPMTPVPSAAGTPRIMVIDDNPTQLELVRIVLERKGWVTELLSRSPGTYEHIVAHPPSAIVLDVMMPEVSGLAILKQLKANPATAGIPVIVVSAYTSNKDVVQQLGALWLPKPWEATTLTSMIAQQLGHT